MIHRWLRSMYGKNYTEIKREFKMHRYNSKYFRSASHISDIWFPCFRGCLNHISTKFCWKFVQKKILNILFAVLCYWVLTPEENNIFLGEISCLVYGIWVIIMEENQVESWEIINLWVTEVSKAYSEMPVLQVSHEGWGKGGYTKGAWAIWIFVRF